MRWNPLTLTLEELALLDSARLIDSITSSGQNRLVVRIATDMLCNARSNGDKAYDWLAALMLGEYIVGLGLDAQWSTVGVPNHILAIDFSITTNLTQSSVDALKAYAASYLSFYTGGRSPRRSATATMFAYEVELFRFEDELGSRVRHFHDIARLYTASYVEGLRDEFLGADYVMMLGRHQRRLRKWLEISALRCSA